MNRAEDWANRMVWERDYFKAVAFVTLTYDDEHLPLLDSLSKRDLQLFFKRLRKRADRELRYFACGEYGEKLGRPHYHAVIFGLDYSERYLVSLCWGLGRTSTAPFLRERALYCAKYLLKEVESGIDLVGRVAPFAIMSKGLGLRFAEANRERIEAGRLTVNGYPTRIPRYFRKKFGGDYTEVVEQRLAELFDLHLARLGPGADPVLDFDRVMESIRLSRDQAEKNFLARVASKEKRDYGI